MATKTEKLIAAEAALAKANLNVGGKPIKTVEGGFLLVNLVELLDSIVHGNEYKTFKHILYIFALIAKLSEKYDPKVAAEVEIIKKDGLEAAYLSYMRERGNK